MAKIYQFPDLNAEVYPEFGIENDNEKPYTEEEINLQYEQYFQWEYDEYLYNRLLKQEQNKQRKRQTCLVHRFVQRISSLFH